MKTKKSKPTKPKRKRSEKIVSFIENHCRVPEGTRVGEPMRLMDWQKREIERIYDNPAGTRRAILSFGRKNGKTSLAACLLLCHLCGPMRRPNSQLFSAAQSREQAALIFGLAAKIVRMSPDLCEAVAIKDAAKELFCPDYGTRYRALSAEASTAYGLSPVFIVHDELGRVRGERSELYTALETGTAAHKDPLSIVISTQAPTDGDLLSKLIDVASKAEDPRTVVSLYTAPIEDDPFALETIRKANPALGSFLNQDEVMDMANSARNMPSGENEYRNLVLNQRVEVDAALFSKNVWSACGATPKSLDGVPVYAGLDLSESKDLTALVLMGRVDKIWQVHSTFWLPREGLYEKSKTDRIPYDVWERQGILTASPGATVDYEYVAEWLANICNKYDVKKIAFDRWNFKHLRPWLLKSGMGEKQVENTFVEFGQGFQSMSPALRDLEVEVLNQRIAHGNHPILTMCALNAVVQRDPAGNRKLAKNRSSGRIDGAVALTMAMGVAPAQEEKKRSYQMVFV